MGHIAVRPESESDRQAIREMVTAAFESDTEANLVDNIRGSDRYVPELSLVAQVDGEIAGFIMISIIDLVDGQNVSAIHSVAPVAVTPRHQGRGVGSKLIESAIARAEALGIPLLVVEGSPSYYSRFAFEHALPLGVVFHLPDWAPNEAGQVRRLSHYDQNTRGRVRYPPAFDGIT